jgi:hypothetical protein
MARLIQQHTSRCSPAAGQGSGTGNGNDCSVGLDTGHAPGNQTTQLRASGTARSLLAVLQPMILGRGPIRHTQAVTASC